MKKAELVSEIIEIASSLDRGDINIDEAIIEAENLVDKDRKQQCDMHVVSRPFNSEGEILSFIYRNIPIAVKPKRKSKFDLINPFTSNNAFEQVCKMLAKKLYKKLLNDC